jgi:cold shock CspA family protein
MPGFIKAENGISALFYASQVPSQDAKGLAVGQLVTFDIETGHPPQAVNISVEKKHYTPHGTEKRPQSIRYVGFQQQGNIRAYRFERPSSSGEVQTAVVSSDLALFVTHHVGLQDGPALCQRLAAAELDRMGPDEQAPVERSITKQDLLAHLADRATPAKKRPGGWSTSAGARATNSPWRGTKPGASFKRP